MKRLLEIFIFFFAFTYADSSDTDVNHVIIDHKGNSIQAIIDSIDLDNVYYQNKLKRYTSFLMILTESITMTGAIMKILGELPIVLAKL